MTLTVHCAHTEKFVGPFVAFVNGNFDNAEHRFLIREASDHGMPEAGNVTPIRRDLSLLKKFVLYARYLNRADRIILHGIFERFILFSLLIQPWLLGRTYWVIWGGDLYSFVGQGKATSVASRFTRYLTKFTIGRIGHMVTYVEGDYALARSIFNSSARYHECLGYVSNVVSITEPAAGKTSRSKGMVILAGNSADRSNQHEEMLQLLSHHLGADDTIYCPLSYGDREHAMRIAALGHQLFGDRFIALTSFMSLHDYNALLDRIDIAVFAHHRQQGMGNMIALIGRGKKVFLRRSVTPWAFFGRLGITVFDYEELNLLSLAEAPAQENINIVRQYFSQDTLLRQWSAIFGSVAPC